MDCRIYLSDGHDLLINNVKNVKAIKHEHDEQTVTLVLYNANSENTNPIATFYSVVGYVTIGERA